MLVTTLSYKTWSSLISPVINALLPKAGFSSKYPREVLFGPKEYQGIGLPHPWYTQELLHIATLITELTNGTQTGQLLRATAEQLTLELGVPGPLGVQNYEKYDLLATPSWIKTVWSSLAQFHM